MKHFDLRRRNYLKNDDLIIFVDFEGQWCSKSDPDTFTQPDRVTDKRLFLYRYHITDQNRSSHSASGVKSPQVRRWKRFSYLQLNHACVLISCFYFLY